MCDEWSGGETRALLLVSGSHIVVATAQKVVDDTFLFSHISSSIIVRYLADGRTLGATF